MLRCLKEDGPRLTQHTEQIHTWIQMHNHNNGPLSPPKACGLDEGDTVKRGRPKQLWRFANWFILSPGLQEQCFWEADASLVLRALPQLELRVEGWKHDTLSHDAEPTGLRG